MKPALPPGPPYRYRAFGLGWHSDLPLAPFTPETEANAATDIRVLRIVGPLPPREFALHPLHSTMYADGTRYIVHPRIALDTYRGDRVQIHTREDWRGFMPAKLFATIPAVLLAWRGCIPLHGSAVEIDGRAVLVCGASGAGKSSTVASLIASGARLLSDDLTVLHPQPDHHAPLVFTGRRGLRLFANTARLLGESIVLRSLPAVSEGKLAVYPPNVDPHRAVPLAAVILLEDGPSPANAEDRATLLERQMFRPVAMGLIPGVHERRVALTRAAASLTVLRLPSADVRDRASFRNAGERVLEHLATGP